VLVIEDDPALAALLVRTFDRAGGTAVVAGDAAAAVAQAGAGSFDAVVCDLILPGIEGTALYHRFLDDFPDLAHRFVYITGWASDGRVRRLVEHTGRPVLHKPFQPAELVTLTRSLTAGSSSPVTARS
jgi:two-component system NtrC family sensor kinase